MRAEFVSLGGDCQPAHHIRRLNLARQAYAFDWLITPIQAVIPLLESHFQTLFERSFLHWTEMSDGWQVLDTRYGIESLHHFKSKNDEHVDQVIERFRGHGRAISDLLDGKEVTVFVRRWHPHDNSAGEAEAAALQEYLVSRNPACLLLYLDANRTAEPALESHFVARVNPPGDDWTGVEAAYDESFAIAHRAACSLAITG